MPATDLLKASEAMLLLGIRDPRTLRRIRESQPEIAVRLPGMKHHRYVRAHLVAIVRAGPARLQSRRPLI